MNDRTRKALINFDKDFNCAQSVFSAFAEEFKIDRETALRLASSFGGGMGRMGLVCGAVTGAFMVLGLEFGFTDPALPGVRDHIYSRIRQFAQEFEARHGSIQCRPLIGYDLSTPEGLAGAQESGVLKTKCKDFIQDAIRLTEKIRSAG